jgi:hypothetical protein
MVTSPVRVDREAGSEAGLVPAGNEAVEGGLQAVVQARCADRQPESVVASDLER